MQLVSTCTILLLVFISGTLQEDVPPVEGEILHIVSAMMSQDERTRKYEELGLRIFGVNQVQLPDLGREFNTVITHNSGGSGDCFFLSLAFLLGGALKKYEHRRAMLLRNRIVDYMAADRKPIFDYYAGEFMDENNEFMNEEKVNSHINQMRNRRTFATDKEVNAAAYLLETNIYVIGLGPKKGDNKYKIQRDNIHHFPRDLSDAFNGGKVHNVMKTDSLFVGLLLDEQHYMAITGAENIVYPSEENTDVVYTDAVWHTTNSQTKSKTVQPMGV